MTVSVASIHPISIADRAGRGFPQTAHLEGYARWKQGSVTIEHASPRAVAAKVRGQQTRHVRLQEEGGRLLVHCTCPALTFEQPACRHVWAALLEVDHRGLLDGLRTTRRALSVGFFEAPSAELPPIEAGPGPSKARKKGRASAPEKPAPEEKPEKKPAKKGTKKRRARA